MSEQSHHELLDTRDHILAHSQSFHARTRVIQRRKLLLIARFAAAEDVKTTIEYCPLVPQSNSKYVGIVRG